MCQVSGYHNLTKNLEHLAIYYLAHYTLTIITFQVLLLLLSFSQCITRKYKLLVSKSPSDNYFIFQIFLHCQCILQYIKGKNFQSKVGFTKISSYYLAWRPANGTIMSSLQLDKQVPTAAYQAQHQCLEAISVHTFLEQEEKRQTQATRHEYQSNSQEKAITHLTYNLIILI